MAVSTDLRYAVRLLVRQRATTILIILTLALGIGATSAMFSVINGVLLRPLPFVDPERIVRLQPYTTQNAESASFTPADYLDFRRDVGAFSVMAGYIEQIIDLSDGAGDPERLGGTQITEQFFEVFGVAPELGRTFDAAHAREDRGGTVVLSHRLWQRRFGGTAAALGRTVRINGEPRTIVGVMPADFRYDAGDDLWILAPRDVPDAPLEINGDLRDVRDLGYFSVVARVKPGVSAAQALAEIERFGKGLTERFPKTNAQRRFRVMPLKEHLVGHLRTALFVLLGAVGCVLLIACANVANLLLARAAARRREIAVRLALGAGRLRLVRQLLTESLTLSIAGGALGLLFAVWSTRGLTSYFAQWVLDVDLDVRVFAFALMASMLTGLLFGAVPALVATRQDLTPTFRGEASSHGARRGGIRAGRLLVAGQVALSLLLLVGAGLFIRTLANLRTMDPGFRGDHVLLATINPGLSRYTPERARGLVDALLERVSALPGVRAASIADMPLLGGSFLDGFRVEATNQNVDAAFRLVSPRFFETMGIAIQRGRDFAMSDRREAPAVAIINDTIARRYFADVDPVGQFITLGKTRAEIVGVIADTKYRSLRGDVPNTLYLPLDQAVTFGTERTLHVRTFAGPEHMAAAVREQVRTFDRSLPVTMSVFSDLVDDNLAQERLIATLSGFFGGLALLLTAIGLYGVIAYTVQRRTREIGIRMSLGAARAAVLWMVLRDALLLIAAGVVAGTIASVWLSRLVARQLFGIAPNDAPTMIAAAVFLIAVATLAGYVPARRASRVDPTVALRHE